MNMWSVDFADNGLLGYAQFPSGAGLPGITPNMEGPAITDGVVAGYSTFGSMDYNDGTFLMQAGYDRGRTMTHEVGHFLGLRHIWEMQHVEMTFVQIHRQLIPIIMYAILL
ncbi:hypothetical protein EJ377_00705 [Chryseobacterium arthrosphaerae]|uniref:Peptidase M43 pregnancy-associated plasma-A domain-containing protein n=1 Tax=Chryseobacterium arthrosphaerae TaxID=651561 RepID=A0A432DYD1_9FLAO|nr:hypothetical protein EJ377_00705 [Chryseobacterium arthrosphaerae]